MKVFALIPVLNRLDGTREIVGCLRRQTGVSVQIVVVDDGSTDGTRDYLAQQPDIIALAGDGNLWWAGAIQLALRTIHPLIKDGDFFAFLNNDTLIQPDFLATLAQVSHRNGKAAVGSIVRDSREPFELLDVGPRADLWRMAVWDIRRDLSAAERENLQDVYSVDFLPGRGTLYPGEVLSAVGYMRPRLLPHYHSDYEFSDRVRRAGFPLLVSSNAVTFSTEAFGNQRKAASVLKRNFGKGSPDNILHRVTLFSMVGTPSQRFSAAPRIVGAWIDRRVHPLKVAVRKVRGRVARPVNRLSNLLRLIASATSWNRLSNQLRLIASATSSGMSRARLFAAVERRLEKPRMEALQAYCAGTLVDIKGGSVLLTGAGLAHQVHYFLRQGAATVTTADMGTTQLMEARAPYDLQYCVFTQGQQTETIPVADLLASQTRIGGVIYCVVYGHPSEHLRHWISSFLDRIKAAPGMDVLFDGVPGPHGSGIPADVVHPRMFAGTPDANGQDTIHRLFAAKRLRA